MLSPDDLLQKIDTLESQLLFQEDMIESLNRTVTELQYEMMHLKTQLVSAVQKIEALSLHEPEIRSLADEIPPHY